MTARLGLCGWVKWTHSEQIKTLRRIGLTHNKWIKPSIKSRYGIFCINTMSSWSLLDQGLNVTSLELRLAAWKWDDWMTLSRWQYGHTNHFCYVMCDSSVFWVYHGLPWFTMVYHIQLESRAHGVFAPPGKCQLSHQRPHQPSGPKYGRFAHLSWAILAIYHSNLWCKSDFRKWAQQLSCWGLNVGTCWNHIHISLANSIIPFFVDCPGLCERTCMHLSVWTISPNCTTFPKKKWFNPLKSLGTVSSPRSEMATTSSCQDSTLTRPWCCKHPLEHSHIYLGIWDRHHWYYGIDHSSSII